MITQPEPQPRIQRETGCTCASCLGIEPWASRFAGCIQAGWARANAAVAAGIASPAPRIL